MPISFGPLLSTAVYDSLTLQLSVTGEAFAENYYAAYSRIQIALHGSGVWVSTDSVDSWSDTAAAGTFAVAPGSGSYDVRVISSDNEISNVLENVFTISSNHFLGSICFSGCIQSTAGVVTGHFWIPVLFCGTYCTRYHATERRGYW